MNWWQTILISVAASVITLIITIIINALINRNKKLQFFIQNQTINNSGYFRFEMAIFNPAKIPQFYDTLKLAFYSGKERLDATQLETPDENRKTTFNEVLCVDVPANTLQPNSLITLAVSGKNKLILKADTIKIEYNTYWAKIFKNRRLVSVKLLNKEQIKEILDKQSQKNSI